MAVNTAINYRLPQVEQLLQHPSLQTYILALSRPVVTDIIRSQFALIRQSERFQVQGVEGVDVLAVVIKACEVQQGKRQVRVINTTGIAVHTNLGRSPIATELWDSAREVNTGYSNLELELVTGKRL
jgi:L-seryl-tRNA(Ser) seleniumtransferase